MTRPHSFRCSYPPLGRVRRNGTNKPLSCCVEPTQRIPQWQSTNGKRQRPKYNTTIRHRWRVQSCSNVFRCSALSGHFMTSRLKTTSGFDAFRRERVGTGNYVKQVRFGRRRKHVPELKILEKSMRIRVNLPCNTSSRLRHLTLKRNLSHNVERCYPLGSPVYQSTPVQGS